MTTKRRADSARVRQGESGKPMTVPRERLVLLRSIAYAVRQGNFDRAQELERELTAYDNGQMVEILMEEGIRAGVFQDAMG